MIPRIDIRYSGFSLLDLDTIVRLGVAQVAPVGLDTDATVARICTWIADAAHASVQVLVFPEALLPGYPRGQDFGAVVGHRSPEGREAFARYWTAAVDIPGDHIQRIGDAVAAANMYVVLGVVERAPSVGTLYCTSVYFGPSGQVLATHRKLKPTASERLIWGEGDGSTLVSISTPYGMLGGLICWENLMPLARAAMYQQGVTLYAAPTADARDTWQATIRHIACEGRCVVLSANQYVTHATQPAEWVKSGARDDVVCRGGSAIVGPLGEYLAGPVWDTEGLLTADLDLMDLVQARFDFDPVGHYARPDVFQLIVHRTPTSSA